MLWIPNAMERETQCTTSIDPRRCLRESTALVVFTHGWMILAETG